MTTYRLSPEAEYPQALEDSWQTYRWILDNIESSLGLKPKKILLSGDSAGANLATGLIGLAICKGLRVPDAFISCYPILLLEPLAFTPSRLLTYDEHILNHLLKKSWMRAYLKDLIPQEHPFLSPFFFPDKVLEQFPPTRVVLAGIDPLHDDGYHFAYRLWMLGKDVKVIDNKCLPHGFLNFELAPFVGGECSKAIEAVSKVIKELITDSTEDQSNYQSPFENIRNGIWNNLKKIEEIIEEKFFETTSDLIN